MRLKEISAKNYRTLQDIVLRFAPDYCTLSGKNNAGKSCVIRLLGYLMEPNPRPWHSEEYSLDYREDRTQWAPEAAQITVKWTISLSRSDEPALIAFIETFSALTITSSAVEVVIKVDVEANVTRTSVDVDGVNLNERASREIVTKLRRSDCLFLHNSAEQQNHFIYAGAGRRRTFYEFYWSEEEQKALSEAGRAVQRKTRQLVKGHRDVLSGMLGKLNDKYDVEFTPFETFGGGGMPFGINLKDKKVEVPINDWGSGTQNRTYIFMSLLRAKRIKDLEGSEEKITPIVVVEEPESFLHPAAQAEFGALLRDLAQDLGIQIIVSTHSPFMLNRVSPSSNILLRRRRKRSQLQETEVVDTAGENWMEPFSEHLGIVSPEFNSWRSLFSSGGNRVLLVEGDIDKEYLSYIRELVGDRSGLPHDVEIQPYGGKGTLKNTALLKFVLSRFDRVFVTFDMDAQRDVTKSLESLGLREKDDYWAVGVNQPGKEDIEGLLPARVTAAVFGRETDLVMQLRAQNTEERRKAKDQLKRRLVEEFRKNTDYSDEELKGFLELGRIFKRAFPEAGS